MENGDYRLCAVVSPEEWSVYHDTRRRILWENRGKSGEYVENHPDEHNPDNHPFLLLFRGKPVGVVRVDIVQDMQQAIIRRMAIRARVSGDTEAGIPASGAPAEPAKLAGASPADSAGVAEPYCLDAKRPGNNETEQRKGHGRNLVTLVERFALHKGCHCTVVGSAEDAQVFYEKCGYKHIPPGSRRMEKDIGENSCDKSVKQNGEV